jgi:hypothetical protein
MYRGVTRCNRPPGLPVLLPIFERVERHFQVVVSQKERVQIGTATTPLHGDVTCSFEFSRPAVDGLVIPASDRGERSLRHVRPIIPEREAV